MNRDFSIVLTLFKKEVILLVRTYQITKISGITVVLDGDATGLSKALQSVNSDIRKTQSQLKDVEKLLKMDSRNT